MRGKRTQRNCTEGRNQSEEKALHATLRFHHAQHAARCTARTAALRRGVPRADASGGFDGAPSRRSPGRRVAGRSARCTPACGTRCSAPHRPPPSGCLAVATPSHGLGQRSAPRCLSRGLPGRTAQGGRSRHPPGAGPGLRLELERGRARRRRAREAARAAPSGRAPRGTIATSAPAAPWVAPDVTPQRHRCGLSRSLARAAEHPALSCSEAVAPSPAAVP